MHYKKGWVWGIQIADVKHNHLVMELLKMGVLQVIDKDELANLFC